MEKIPTARQYMLSKMKYSPIHEELLIEFAKLHVEAALKEASEKALTTWATTDFYDDRKVVSKSSILKSYPLTNIK